MRGKAILIGGAPAGAEFTADHMSTLWGKSIVGTLGGSGRSAPLIGALMALYATGRFPIDRLVERFPLDRIGEAMEASYSGEVVKPVITMPQG